MTTTIATDVDDSAERMKAKAVAQKQRPGFAIDPYFIAPTPPLPRNSMTSCSAAGCMPAT